jgi:hypothetical protein
VANVKADAPAVIAEAEKPAKAPETAAEAKAEEAIPVLAKAPEKKIPEKFRKVSVGDKMPAFLL